MTLATSPSRAVLEGGKETVVEKKKSKKRGKTIKTDDVIVKTVFEIENATNEETLERTKETVDGGDRNSFQLGGYLARISDRELHKETGYERFSVYTADQLGLPSRKAYYLIGFYKAIVEAQLVWAEVKDLGWAKLRVLSRIITKENAKEWIEAAQKFGCVELEEMISKAKEKPSAGGGSPPAGDGTTSMAFKLHKDQKEIVDAALAKCMEDSGTEHKSVALEYICQEYLAGGDRPVVQSVEDVTLVDLMKNKTPKEVMDAFSEVWPEADVTIEM